MCRMACYMGADIWTLVQILFNCWPISSVPVSKFSADCFGGSATGKERVPHPPGGCSTYCQLLTTSLPCASHESWGPASPLTSGSWECVLLCMLTHLEIPLLWHLVTEVLKEPCQVNGKGFCVHHYQHTIVYSPGTCKIKLKGQGPAAFHSALRRDKQVHGQKAPGKSLLLVEEFKANGCNTKSKRALGMVGVCISEWLTD